MPLCTRREFTGLLILGATGAALGATLPGCGNNGASFDGSITPAGNQALLSYSQFPSLRAAGGAAIVDVKGSFPIAVVRTTAVDAVALSATCTHVGCILRYAADLKDLHCDCHDADFSLAGEVLGGPTRIPLPTYPATVGADAITVSLA